MARPEPAPTAPDDAAGRRGSASGGWLGRAVGSVIVVAAILVCGLVVGRQLLQPGAAPASAAGGAGSPAPARVATAGGSAAGVTPTPCPTPEPLAAAGVCTAPSAAGGGTTGTGAAAGAAGATGSGAEAPGTAEAVTPPPASAPPIVTGAASGSAGSSAPGASAPAASAPGASAPGASAPAGTPQAGAAQAAGSPAPEPTPGDTAPTSAAGFDVRHTVVPMAFPLPATAKYTYGAGWRVPRDGPARPYEQIRGVAPDGTYLRAHGGIDIVVKLGTPVYAPFAGKVIDPAKRWKPWDPARYGNVVVIESTEPTSPGYTVLLAHLSTKKVKVGDTVERGQLVGKTGKTGNAAGTPPHLHLELHAPFKIRYGYAHVIRRLDVFDAEPSVRAADPKAR